MPNPIKYTTGSETLALKKGNFYIGTGDVGKGPSDTTGYYNGVSPSSGGYVIYLNREGAPGNLSYHSAANDGELITFTNNLAGQSFTSVTQCLVYYATQNDKVVLNRDYEGIVTNGLVLNLDAGFTPSYPTSATTWYDISTSNTNGTLTNGPTYSTDGGGSIVFDGVDDYVRYVLPSDVSLAQGTILMFIYNTYENYYLQYYDRLNSKGAATTTTVPTGFVQVGVTYDGNHHYFHINGETIQAQRFGIYGYDATSPPSVGLFGRGRNDTGTSDNVINLSFSLNSYQLGSNNPPNANTFFENFTSSSSGYFNLSSGVLGKLPAVSRPRNFNGNIYQTLIYNRALSAVEVLQNYNAQKGRFGL